MANVFKRAKDLLGKSDEAKLAPLKPDKSWHAVSILPGTPSCAAATALKAKRFLSREAPVLPLKACGETRCTCRYAHHADRRNGPRRVSELGVAVDGYDGKDQRVSPKRGRRKTDRR